MTSEMIEMLEPKTLSEAWQKQKRLKAPHRVWLSNRIHWLAHLLGWNQGEVVSRLQGDEIYIGFQCAGCGKVRGWHASPVKIARGKTDGYIDR